MHYYEPRDNGVVQIDALGDDLDESDAYSAFYDKFYYGSVMSFLKRIVGYPTPATPFKGVRVIAAP
jgi:hypothetical protein